MALPNNMSIFGNRNTKKPNEETINTLNAPAINRGLSGFGVFGKGLPGISNNTVNNTSTSNNTPINNTPNEIAVPMPTTDPINVIQKYEPQKTPQQMEADRIAAAQKQDEVIAGQVQDYQQAPDTAVKRYDVKEFDNGPFNEAEDIFQRNTIEGLKTGKFGDVESAFARTGRDSALRTARGQQSGEAMAAAAGLQPGTPEYQRAVDIATSNAEAQNLADSNANRQMQRSYYNDAMNRAEKIGRDMYNRASGERDIATAADAVEYSRNDTRFNNDQQDIRDFITSLPPNVANKARVLLSQGKDPRTALGYFDATGAIAAPYRGATPSEQSYTSQWQDAIVRTPRMAGESDADYNTRVANAIRDRLAQQDAVAFNPVNTANTAQGIKDTRLKQVEKKLQTGNNLNESDWSLMLSDRPDLMDSIPVAETISGTGQAKKAQPGQVVSYNGQKYLVLNPKWEDRNKDWYGDEVQYGIEAVGPNGQREIIARTNWQKW